MQNMTRKAVRPIDSEAPVKIRSIQAWEYTCWQAPSRRTDRRWQPSLSVSFVGGLPPGMVPPSLIRIRGGLARHFASAWLFHRGIHLEATLDWLEIKVTHYQGVGARNRWPIGGF